MKLNQKNIPVEGNLAEAIFRDMQGIFENGKALRNKHHKGADIELIMFCCTMFWVQYQVHYNLYLKTKSPRKVDQDLIMDLFLKKMNAFFFKGQKLFTKEGVVIQ